MTDIIYKKFMQKVEFEPNTGCWLWDGNFFQGKDYGRFRGKRAHRISYEYHKGIIPEGLLVCHKCDTPACVNPDHLWLGTSYDNHTDRENKGRGASIKKTHCPSGHEYSKENTKIRKRKSRSKRGYSMVRECKTCIELQKPKRLAQQLEYYRRVRCKA